MKKIGFLVLFLLPFLIAAQENKFDILTDIEIKTFKNPWSTYQSIIALRPSLKDQPRDIQLLWHQEKATAENLLYFHNDFVTTVAEARKLLNNDSDLTIKTKLIFYAGLIAQRDNEYNKATELFTNAMTLAQNIKNNVLYIRIKQELAYTRSLTELFDASLKDMQSAYVDAFTLNDEFLIAVINETYGAIYGYMNEYEKSIEYYQKAFESYEQFGYQAHTAEAVFGLASTYRYWKKYDLAIEYFERYQELISYTPNLNISFLSAYGLGMTLAEKGDCQRALKVIDKALSLGGQIDYDAELYKRKSLCYIQLGDFNNAELFVTKAEAVFADIPELKGTKWQLETIKLRGQLAHAKKDYLSAFTIITEYYEKFTKQLIENSSSRLVNVRQSLELERKNVELDLLAQRTQVQLLEVEKERQVQLLQRYLIIFLAIIVIVIVTVLIIQRKSHKKVLSLSIKDDLTGLYNRRYIFDFWEKLLIKNKDKGQMSILIIDIDNFKVINDQYGHPAGDFILKKIADLTVASLRTEDVIGRIGGEEFLCLLPRVDEALTVIIATRLLESIAQTEFILKSDRKINVSVSIGIRCINNVIDSNVNVLFAQADQALYRAKRQGKNQLVVFKERTI